jgi:2-oxoglutarate ferredoxin oxidoreductase subunit gamma
MSELQVGIRFGGLGGQGLVTLGAVLAEAGALANLQVAASQAYGSRARGGATRADVILSKEPIDFPHVIEPDLLVVLAQEAYDLYSHELAPSGVILVDDFFVHRMERTGIRQKTVPATSAAMEKLGNKVAANFIMLGTVVGYTAVVNRAEVETAIEHLVNPRFQQVNHSAFALGWDLGRQLAGTEVGPWR